MAYTVLDRVYSIFIDVMTGVSSGNGNATFYNTDSHTSYIEVTVTNGVQSFDMTEYNYVLVIDKPNKQTYRNEYTTTDKSKLVIEMDSQMLAGVGNNKGQLYIMKTADNVAKVLTMVEFNYIVKEGNYNELAPESNNHDALYITLRNDVDSILQMIENGEIGSGSGSTGMTPTQKEQLATAYNHAMTDAVTTTDVVNSAVATYVEANKATLKGDKGDKGDTGVTGAKGDKGDPFTYSDFTPEQLAALKGAKGDKGEKGDTGAKGANGITPTLRVGSTSTGNAGTNANVTMTDSNNVYTLNFVIPRGDKGEAGTKGQDGAKGADGITPTLKVGTVTTLAAGSNATVTMSKNNNEYTLNFGIPKGNKGDTGASGGSGETTVVNPTITIGTVTNGDTASATITGDSPNYTLNLVLPKGDKGAKGDAGVKGADGITPTIAVGTTTTGEAGTNAEVTMSKSGTTYTFNFVIPKGAKGDTGAAGTNGVKGDKGDPFTYADFTSEQLAALKGAKGDKGDKGDTGADGVAGAKGDKGDRGEKGADGVTPTLSIGTVTTGAAGSSASVTMGGTAPSYVLNFTIPKGDKGDKGDTGASGSGSSSGGGEAEWTLVTRYTHTTNKVIQPSSFDVSTGIFTTESPHGITTETEVMLDFTKATDPKQIPKEIISFNWTTWYYLVIVPLSENTFQLMDNTSKKPLTYAVDAAKQVDCSKFSFQGSHPNIVLSNLGISNSKKLKIIIRAATMGMNYYSKGRTVTNKASQYMDSLFLGVKTIGNNAGEILLPNKQQIVNGDYGAASKYRCSFEEVTFELEEHSLIRRINYSDFGFIGNYYYEHSQNNATVNTSMFHVGNIGYLDGVSFNDNITVIDALDKILNGSIIEIYKK